MFIVKGRTLGVFAALGVALSMVVLDRLSDVADSTEPRSLSVFMTAVANLLPTLRHDAKWALVNGSVASTRPSAAVAWGDKLNPFRDYEEHEACAECSGAY